MKINAERLWQSLMELAEIGATPEGGVSRLALSDEDRAGRDLLRGWMEEAGLAVRVDDFGNIIGRREGTDSEAEPVILGSHIDSVREGGRFDGPVGVLGALEVIRTLNDHGVKTVRPIEVVNWTNEEGARFEPAMMGSAGGLGLTPKETIYAVQDRDGKTFGDELRRIGYAGEEANRVRSGRVYLELHIEQGPVLDEEEVPVGVVEGIVGLAWLEVTVRGRASHAGTTPMTSRRDALAAAAGLVVGVESLALQVGNSAVGTVGRIDVQPDVINVIPREVVFGVDLRAPGKDDLQRLLDGFQGLCEEIGRETGTTIEVESLWSSDPAPFAPEVVDAIQSSVEQLGLPVRRLWSGAGHDAKCAQSVMPSGMIFVRTRGGLSHSKEEDAAPEDIALGTNALLQTALHFAG